MECREWLIRWLNDAHAMEEGMVNTLDNHVKQLDDQPDIQNAVRAHREHTKSQAERVRRCLEILGEKPSTIKKWGLQMVGPARSAGRVAADDRVIKDLLVEYASQHFEIAGYRALVQAAIVCGEQQVAMLCEEALREEEQMAHTLSRNLENVVSSFLRSPVGAGAW